MPIRPVNSTTDIIAIRGAILMGALHITSIKDINLFKLIQTKVIVIELTGLLGRDSDGDVSPSHLLPPQRHGLFQRVVCLY